MCRSNGPMSFDKRRGAPTEIDERLRKFLSEFLILAVRHVVADHDSPSIAHQNQHSHRNRR
jgi:hypothetical protein